MKTTSLLHVIGCGLALSSAVRTVHAQGLVNFNNRVIGVVVAPVYGPESGDATLAKTGNTASGTPAGTTTYGGALLSGTGYTAELWGGPLGTPEFGLSFVASAVFRTTPAGFVVAPASPVAVPGVPGGNMATLQLRVWDNQGGTVLSWAAAQANPVVVASGASQIFASPPLGDGMSPPPNLTGLRSFNIHLAAPSPLRLIMSTIAGGGGRSSRGALTLASTIGQFNTAVPRGSSLSVAGGFWGIFVVPTPGAPRLEVERLANGSARVLWPLPASGFVLDQTMALSNAPAATVWTQVPFPYQTNATHIFITEPSPVGHKFFRLRKP